MGKKNKKLRKRVKSIDKSISDKEADVVASGLVRLRKASRSILKAPQIFVKKIKVGKKYKLGKAVNMSEGVGVGERFEIKKNGIVQDLEFKEPNEQGADESN